MNQGTNYGGLHGPQGTGQHRANPTDVAWLAGVLDGEGSFVANWIRDRRIGKYRIPTYFGINITIHLSNTSLTMIEEAQRILQTVCHKKFKIGSNHHHTQRCDKVIYTMVVTGQASVAAACEALIPHLRTKRTQAQTLLEWSQLRRANRHLKKRYTYEEYEIVDRVKELRRAESTMLPWGRVSTERPSPVVLGPKGPYTWMMLQSDSAVTRAE